MVGRIFRGLQIRAAAADLYNTYHSYTRALPSEELLLVLEGDWLESVPSQLSLPIDRTYQITSEGNVRTYSRHRNAQLQKALSTYNKLREQQGRGVVVLVDGNTIAELEAVIATASGRTAWAQHVSEAFARSIRGIRADAGER